MAALTQTRHQLEIETGGASLVDVTGRLADWLAGIGASEGLLTVFVRHTSASLTIQESTDPAARADLVEALDRIAPQGEGYRHASEGPDDMPAHIKAMLTSVSLSIPVVGGRLTLGSWQAVYLIEHRKRPQRRSLMLHFLGARGE